MPARSGSRPGPRCARGSGGARDWTTVRSACTTRWPPWASRRPRRRGWPGSSVRRGWPGPNRPRDRGRRGAGSTCPAPNACWQLDATEYVLAGGRKAVIWPAPGRPLAPGGGLPGRPGRDQSGGHRRLRQGRGRPGRAPGARAADNGAAPGPSRRGVTGRLVEHVRSLGVEPPAGRPYRPTTQGKNERFHQTLLRHPGRQPLADSIAEPPGDGSTASTTPCNTQRPHQGLPGRITPQQAQDAGEVARAPRPGHGTDPITPGGEPARDAPAGRRPPHRRRPIAPSGEREAGHHPQQHRPHRRHRVPGPPRPGRAPNHRDLGRHHHHLRRRPRRGPDPVQPAARRRHLRLPPPARPHQPTRQAPAAGGPNRHRSPDTPNVTHVLTQNRHPCPETSQFQPSFSKAKCTSRVQNANLDREGTRAGRRVIASGRRGQAGTGRARGRRPAEDCGVGTGPLTRWCAARSGPP